MTYKSIDGLMRHLRNNGIAISGTPQKRKLMNTGYFHGYKGYRFFRDPSNRLPFISYDEVYATIEYDSKLKALFYSKVMFIETAVKNIALECILNKTGSENIQDMYDRAISGYRNAPPDADENKKRKLQKEKLQLQKNIQNLLVSEYGKGNRKITHFYNHMSYNDVPIWALVEIMMLGDFAQLLSCLTIETREDISRKLGIELRDDTYRELIYNYLYMIKDLRNAVAHNNVIFDTRFRKKDPTPAMTTTLKNEVGLPYVNFKTIGDYLILTCYYLKLLKVSKTEINVFIREFEKIVDEYKAKVSMDVAAIVIHPDQSERIRLLKNFI